MTKINSKLNKLQLFYVSFKISFTSRDSEISREIIFIFPESREAKNSREMDALDRTPTASKSLSVACLIPQKRVAAALDQLKKRKKRKIKPRNDNFTSQG